MYGNNFWWSASISAVLGDKDQAMRLLNQAFQNGVT
jgi:hypothetical protein